MVAIRKTGARHARARAMWQGTQRDDNVARAAAPRCCGRLAIKARGDCNNQTMRRFQRRISYTICECGARRPHLWTLRRGVTMQATPSQASRQQRHAREAQSHNIARGNTPRRGRRRAINTWGNGARPGNEASLAENRNHGLGLGRAARTSVAIAAQCDNAGHIVARLKTGVRRTRMRHARCCTIRGPSKGSRRAPPCGATCARRARRGAATSGRATRNCRWRIANTVLHCGHASRHLRTSWHGATVRAASSQAAWAGVTRARIAPCGMAHGDITTSRAATPRNANDDGQDRRGGGGGQPGNKALPVAPGTRKRSAN